MKIIWNQNPLATVVELDDHDKELLRLRVKVAYLTEVVSEVHFDLDPDHQEWCRAHLKERYPVDFLANARQHLDYEVICCDGRRDGKTFDEYVAEQAQGYAAELARVHVGDCTCVRARALSVGRRS